MDNLSTMVLLAQQEHGLWRLLAPLLAMAGIFVFGWINEKIKKREQQQQAQDKARSQAENEGTIRSEPAEQTRSRQMDTRTAPAPQAQRQARPRSAQQIHRYQPQIPSAPTDTAAHRQQQSRESELVIMAEDVNAEAAQRQFRLDQQRRSQAQALRRTRAQQARSSREPSSQTKRDIRKNLDTRMDTETLVQDITLIDGTAVSDELGAGVSRSQIRAAIVWSEILGTPRAMKPYEQLF